MELTGFFGLPWHADPWMAGSLIRICKWEEALGESKSDEETLRWATSRALDLAEGPFRKGRPVPKAAPLRGGDHPISLTSLVRLPMASGASPSRRVISPTTHGAARVGEPLAFVRV